MTFVSVGIPTFNRAVTLRRAAESVLAQTHRELELVIADDGSTDATETVSRELCARDERVRYLRAPVNRGLSANFTALYAELRGQFVMTLSDDDWLAADYVTQCLAALHANPVRATVCGRARYMRGVCVVHEGALLALEQPDVAGRVLAYLRNVDENGLLYGLSRRETLRQAAPMRNVLGNDWLIVLNVLAQGTAVTLESTSIMRDVGGASADVAKLVATLGLPRYQALAPRLVMGTQVLAEILWRGRAFRRLTLRERAVLGVRAAATVFDWRTDALHATVPAATALARRRRGAPLWRAYLWLTRRLGSTHEWAPRPPAR
jgi:hypothetical protein